MNVIEPRLLILGYARKQLLDNYIKHFLGHVNILLLKYF